jgi:hypothetical protein
MNKTISFIILSLMLIAMLGAVSADAPVSTIVSGTIYQNDINHPVAGANVQVTCHHVVNNAITDSTLSWTSETNGAYSVTFLGNQCSLGDLVTVDAQKDNVGTGTEDGVVNSTHTLIPGLILDTGVINVPMVPEFGLIAGLTTVLGALGVFFVVRRK